MFQINKLHLCKPLIRAIDSSNLKTDFSPAQTVTYKYYVGRKAMFDSDFKLGKTCSRPAGTSLNLTETRVNPAKTCSNPCSPCLKMIISVSFLFSLSVFLVFVVLAEAEEYLSYSFDHCHRSSQKNKRMILIYLLPVKMLLVRTPSSSPPDSITHNPLLLLTFMLHTHCFISGTDADAAAAAEIRPAAVL